jgi:hypothetical protein
MKTPEILTPCKMLKLFHRRLKSSLKNVAQMTNIMATNGSDVKRKQWLAIKIPRMDFYPALCYRFGIYVSTYFILKRKSGFITSQK